LYGAQSGSTAAFGQRRSEDEVFAAAVPRHRSTSGRQTAIPVQVKVTTYDPAKVTEPVSQLSFQFFVRAFKKYVWL